jgi:hypothetical protein
MGVSVPALSVRQPWAELIISGRKTVEVRSWITEYRGKMWLHTGRTSDSNIEKAFGLHDLFKGGYIGSVVLSATVPLDCQRWELWRKRHLISAEYEPGLFGWILEGPIRFHDPIVGPGSLNLFHPAKDIGQLLHDSEARTIAHPRSDPSEQSSV